MATSMQSALASVTSSPSSTDMMLLSVTGVSIASARGQHDEQPEQHRHDAPERHTGVSIARGLDAYYRKLLTSVTADSHNPVQPTRTTYATTPKNGCWVAKSAILILGGL